MTVAEIEGILVYAISNLAKGEVSRGEFTSQTGQTEWNLVHHLACALESSFPDHTCDVDITKHDFGHMRPDIIIHRRGTNEGNLLVVEVKLNGSPADVEGDRQKIQNSWFANPLHYHFGATVNIRSRLPAEIQVMENALPV